MKELKFYCDICQKEFLPVEFSFVNGQIEKLNEKLEAQRVSFEGHYCGECTKKILAFIESLGKKL